MRRTQIGPGTGGYPPKRLTERVPDAGKRCNHASRRMRCLSSPRSSEKPYAELHEAALHENFESFRSILDNVDARRLDDYFLVSLCARARSISPSSFRGHTRAPLFASFRLSQWNHPCACPILLEVSKIDCQNRFLALLLERGAAKPELLRRYHRSPLEVLLSLSELGCYLPDRGKPGRPDPKFIGKLEMVRVCVRTRDCVEPGDAVVGTTREAFRSRPF